MVGEDVRIGIADLSAERNSGGDLAGGFIFRIRRRPATMFSQIFSAGSHGFCQRAIRG